MKMNMKEWVAETIRAEKKESSSDPLFSGNSDYRTHGGRNGA